MQFRRLVDGRLKVRHLLLADALTTNGSVVGAAAALHVTQPVVTRGLQDLEAILEVPLYERGSRGVVPTEFGVAFTEHARTILAQLQQAARHLEELEDGSRGTVEVGVHLVGANYLLPSAVAHVKARHPKLTVKIRQGAPHRLMTDLKAGRVDMIVGRLNQRESEGTIRRHLYRESFHVVARRGHPLAGSDPLRVEEVIHFPWILPGDDTDLRVELESFFLRHAEGLPTNRVETTSYLTLRQLLLQTDSVAALPGLIAERDEQLIVLPLSLDTIGNCIGVTLADDRTVGPAARAMLGSLHAAAAEITAATEGPSIESRSGA